MILTSSIIAALFLLFFYAGYRFGIKQQSKGIEVSKDNIEAIEAYSQFINYGGSNKWK